MGAHLSPRAPAFWIGIPVAADICTGVRAVGTATGPICAGVRVPLFSATWARSAAHWWTGSTSTSKFLRLPIRRCAARPLARVRPKCARVSEARVRQAARGFVKAEIPPCRLRELCPLDEAGERVLEMAVRRLALSARCHDRILKVARTIADLGGVEQIQMKHIAEAVQYRSLDRQYWK